MTTHQPTAAVRESFAQAQQQAAAMTGPATPWKAPAPQGGRARRWIGLAATSLVVVGVAGWLGAEWLGGPIPAESATASSTVARPAPADASMSAAAGHNALTEPVPHVAQAPATAPSLTVSQRSGVIRIAAANASLADAVRALAKATRTTVHGGEALASVATPITMQWQGKDTAASWEALLGHFANFAFSCGGESCTLWVVGLNAASAANPVSGSGTAATELAAPPRPAVRPQAAPTEPEDENTETN